jgi:hypothetical protein
VNFYDDGDNNNSSFCGCGSDDDDMQQDDSETQVDIIDPMFHLLRAWPDALELVRRQLFPTTVVPYVLPINTYTFWTTVLYINTRIIP